MWPRAGGQYVFLREAYGPATGFLFGWSLFLVIQTGTIAAVAVAFANFMGVLTDSVSGDRYLIAPRALGGYAISLSTQQLVAVADDSFPDTYQHARPENRKVHSEHFHLHEDGGFDRVDRGRSALGWNENSAAYTSSWWKPWANGWSPQASQLGFETSSQGALLLALVMLLGRAMVGPLFAQSAWNNVTFTAGEVRDPGRNLPRALLLGCGLVVALYLLANLAYIVTLPLSGIQNAPQNRVATATMQAIFGPPGTTLMAIAIMISTFGCNNGLILAGARVYYAMSRDNLFFKRVGTLNERHVPAVALIAQGLWAAFLTLPRTVTTDSRTGVVTYGNVYTQLLEYIVSADLVFYMLMVGAVIVMRYKAPQLERPYRTFGYPLVPMVYIVLAALFVLDLAYLAPSTSGIGYLIVLTGIPIYFVWRRGAVVKGS